MFGNLKNKLINWLKNNNKRNLIEESKFIGKWNSEELYLHSGKTEILELTKKIMIYEFKKENKLTTEKIELFTPSESVENKGTVTRKTQFQGSWIVMNSFFIMAVTHINSELIPEKDQLKYKIKYNFINKNKIEFDFGDGTHLHLISIT